MLRGRHFPEQVGIQRLVSLEFSVGGFYALLNNVLERVALAQLDTETDRLPQTLQVKRVLQVPVVKEGLLRRIGGLQPQFARTGRQLYAAGQANAHRLHSVAATVYALGGE